MENMRIWIWFMTKFLIPNTRPAICKCGENFPKRRHANRSTFTILKLAFIEPLQCIRKLAQHLSGEKYLKKQNTLLGLLDDIPLNIRQTLWFVHDESPAHFNINIHQFLDTTCKKHWIGREGRATWPTSSLNPSPDFYTLGYLKLLVYAAPTEICEQLYVNTLMTLEIIEALMNESVVFVNLL
ncbi:transposable element tc3 transposase-like protein [Holotrichia oblita]|uniref:Transposable element tc3 transposase-like protein n=1 Tax=Holotrichia oblita TaxID=644536 RepID=A0ACB9SGX9_HOLOL|nr:transposable element tc3 transposase-like protein [Holotrichia oblita]